MSLTLVVIALCLWHCRQAAASDTMAGSGQVVQDAFGSVDSRSVDRFTLRNKNGMEVQVISYGATITSIKAADKNGKIEDLVLGFDDIDGYLKSNNPYFGATIGRVANRINSGKFKIGDKSYQISLNKGNFTLHGGFKGFDKVIWDSYVNGNKVIFSYVSCDGEEGYPGAVLSQVTYELTDDNELKITMNASSTKPTPVNLCNHSYFNLGGHATGAQSIYDHLAMINADYYTVTDKESIPTGEIASVADTPFDLRKSTPLKTGIPAADKFAGKGGYDHNLCINSDGKDGLQFVARVLHPNSGRQLEVYSNQPGVQFYTGNSISEITGKGGNVYKKHAAFCLETQVYPDAVNHANFPNSILYPGDDYHHEVIYKFTVKT
ncbi:galactose mutarotase-like [Bacillus rossius redtenbacheri]|uniref:galactose mutarotase-like n=1 Tax=Bacillus rossius redtenbacheri TaxID=93214 RepID=UPI002FDE350D